MVKRYSALGWCIALALIGLAVLALAVAAQELGPPNVIAVRPINNKVTQLGSAVAVDPVRGYAYVLNQDSLIIFQGTTISETIPLGASQAIATAPDQGYVYVTRGINQGDDQVTVLSGSMIVGSVSLHANAGGLAVMPTTGYAYVTLPDQGKVVVLNGTTEVTRITAGITPTAVAVNPLANLIYVANGGSNSLSIIQDHNVLTTVVLGGIPTNVAANPNTNNVYVSCEDDAIRIVHDNAVAATIPITSPSDIAVNPETGKAYVLASFTASIEQREGWVGVLEGTTLQKIIGLGKNRVPNAIAANSHSGYIYVAAGRDPDGAVTIISDTKTIATFFMKQAPFDVAVDTVADMGYVAIHTSKVVIFGRTEIYRSPPIDTGSSATLVCTGTHGLPVLVAIPAGAIPPEAGTVVIACAALPEALTEPDFLWAGQAFYIAIYREGVDVPDFEFAAPVTLTVSYGETWLGGASENELELRAQTGGIAEPQWELPGINLISRNAPQDKLVATILYPADYALMAPFPFVYLPLIVRNAH